MTDRGILIRGNEAFDFIEAIKDSVTRTLVKMALVKFVVEAHAKREAPEGALDLLYVAKVLEGFFAEHDVIARTLQGENVGTWFEDFADTTVGEPGSV